MSSIPVIGVQIPRILLPKPGHDLSKWAVIACDQFTSEPEYWQEVAALVGDAASTYHMILPEVYLETPEEARRLRSIHSTMHDYLSRGVFSEHEGIVLVERTAAGRTRHGIMLALDLEQYDYGKGSASLIRATEGTILERIPPRVRIRSGAPLELPHILVLIDDPERTVIEPLVAARQRLRKLYDFDLMLGSGRLSGCLVDDTDLEQQALDALGRLAEPAVFAKKYDVAPDVPVMVFAMGDGNHSLATAKAIWEQIKATVGPDHPARHALVEIENIHDTGLVFEPIRRVLFDVKTDFIGALEEHTAGRCYRVQCASPEAMIALVESQAERGGAHAFGVITAQGFSVAYVPDPPSNLAVGTLQSFLDAWGKAGGFGKMDYVHGADVIVRLGSQPGNVGLYLPVIAKSAFFKTVILDGALPRKTFSMGEAREKRFYMEARRIL
jgi:hypothetical protein